MGYMYLIFTIIFEVLGTISMKLSLGFTKLVPSILLFVFYGLSLGALTLTLREMEVSIAYAIWSGVGTGLIAIISVVWFKETFSIVKLISITLIIVGVIGLNMTNGSH